MKHRPVVEQGAHKEKEFSDVVRELKELETDMRRVGSHRAAKTCADAARIIKAVRSVAKANGVNL